MISPLVQEIPYRDPVEAFAALADTPYAQLLHSCPGAAGGGHYSFIAMDPFETLTTIKGVTQNHVGTILAANPFHALQSTLQAYVLHSNQMDLPPFHGGAMGYFGYELLHVLETIPLAEASPFECPEMDIGFYDVIAAYDTAQEQAWIISTGLPETDGVKRQSRAQERTESLTAHLQKHHQPAPSPRHFSPARSNTSHETYIARVKNAIEYIYAGDIYQANISQCFSTDLPENVQPYELFQRIIALNPVSFAAFINTPHATLISNSPERFLKVQGQMVETRPIKGTRPRGTSKAADHALKVELAQSAKDRAENAMIVDLLRNDLSKVCTDDSVEVTDLCGVETYATLHHLVSTITGTLSQGYDAVDLLKACFPGGSITGAPKVRAMEIITELENQTRGPYCGAIGYLGFDGVMDTNIAIRTMTIPHARGNTQRRIFYPVGGGIVADSDPDMEYEESLVKAKAFFDMLADPHDRDAI